MPEISTQINPSAREIDRCLPQTQCARCGYPRCRAYANAIARGTADINRCPPGGDITVAALASLLRRQLKPIDPTCGEHRPRIRARIIESRCIGCTLCIQVCPVDAIAGRAKRMHTIIADYCTGCELCPPACPVDCIELVADTRHPAADNSPWPDYSWREVRRARRQTLSKLRRLACRRRQRQAGQELTKDRDRIRSEIEAAVERVRKKRNLHEQR